MLEKNPGWEGKNAKKARTDGPKSGFAFFFGEPTAQKADSLLFFLNRRTVGCRSWRGRPVLKLHEWRDQVKYSFFWTFLKMS